MPLSLEQLRTATLSRQFPVLESNGVEAIERLFAMLGPVQSQAPRAPFTCLAARLPGATHADLVAAFENYSLVKNSTLRGTVHVVTAAAFGCVSAVAVSTRRGPFAAHLKLERTTLTDVIAEVERYCAEWRTRDAVVAHAREWLARHEGERAAALLDAPLGANHVWGHASLIRRPPDLRWERRTDTLHRTAASVIDVTTPTDPLAALVRMHLLAHGPATRRDLAWWSGDSLGRVDAALKALGEEVEPLGALDGVAYWDVAARPRPGTPPSGWRLLPEYDALVCAFAPDGRRRFLPEGHNAATDRLQHRQYSPLVLHDGRVRGTWRLTTTGPGTHVEVTMLPGERTVDPSEFADPVAALAQANTLIIDDVRCTAQP